MDKNYTPQIKRLFKNIDKQAGFTLGFFEIEGVIDEKNWKFWEKQKL